MPGADASLAARISPFGSGLTDSGIGVIWGVPYCTHQSSPSSSGRTYSPCGVVAAENSCKFMQDLCADGMAQTSRMHLGSTRGTDELMPGR